MSKIQPVIKWSGSKRLLAEDIIQFIPEKIGTYYEPFLGGGSVMLTLKPEKAVGIDVNSSLIDFWQKLKTNPQLLIDHYRTEWNLLQQDYREFERVRARYNQSFMGEDLLFLTRTCVNGLIRYNKNGEFNNSLHYSRKGIHPDKLEAILLENSRLIEKYDFFCGDYRKILESVKEGDFVYLDPPYFNTKSMYYGKINYDELWDFLRELRARNVKFALSFDGTTDKRDYMVNVPADVYQRHIMLKGGKSTFNKIIDKTCNEVMESLYLSW